MMFSKGSSSFSIRVIRLILLSLSASVTTSTTYTLIVVKEVSQLGPQHNPDVTGISRDGGATVLLNGNIIWLYDDTECWSDTGTQLSFVSNTASFSHNPNGNVSTVKDFGVVNVGNDNSGNAQYAILADKTVGTGGWVPFGKDELEFNQENVGVKRVAIWPGTNPTPIGTQSAFLYAPLVYVDAKPEDPSKLYQSRGITLISIIAPNSGPIATRVADLLFPGNSIPFGGFAALLGAPSLDSTASRPAGDRDAYLFGYTDTGLQVARIALDHITETGAYTFFHPNHCNFTNTSPDPLVNDSSKIYLTGTYASGSIFYSPFFETFLFVYLNKLADSTFYIRYLDLDSPSCGSPDWIKGGKQGTGIGPDDAEAIVWYEWSPQQTLYVSPPAKGGFNYAGFVHPEFFNRQYLSPSLYDSNVPASERQNEWYGANVLAESVAGGDGKNLLLSWTSQEQGGFTTGIYQVMLGRLTFDNIPPHPSKPRPTTLSTTTASPSPSPSKSIAYGIGDPNGAGILGISRAKLPRGLVHWAAVCYGGLLLGFWVFV